MDKKRIGLNIRKRRLELGNLVQKDIADFIKVKPSYVTRIENGQANVTLDKLIKIADFLKTPLHNLFAPEPLVPKSYAEKEPAIVEIFQTEETKQEYNRFRTRDDFIPIRIVGEASLGHGRIVSEEETEGYALIYKHALRKRAYDKIVGIFAKGNSMKPTIQNESLVAIDIEDIYDIQNYKIYVIDLPDEGVTIKRVYKNGHYLMLFADNKDFLGYPKCLNVSQCSYHPIQGKVIWTWNKLD